MPGTWLTITATLNSRAAATGWHNQRIARYTVPLPIRARNNHSGVASRASGGRKYDSIMCCNMCPE